MTKLYLITGCLGAGKTTFLQNLLTKIENKKVGVLINEFGALGIDGSLVSDNKLDKIELNNGSIFCTCLKDNFIQGLSELIEKKLDLIFVEASGLSDPASIGQIVEFIRGRVKNEFIYGGSICLIDPLYFEKQIKVLSNTENQVKVSDILVVNKMDLISEEESISLENNLRELNETAKIIKTSFGEIKLDLLNELTSVNENKIFDEIPIKRPEIFTIDINNNSLKNSVEFLKEISKSCYRIKGNLHTENKIFKIDSVMDSFNIEENTDNQIANITLISKVGMKIISDINNLVDKTNIRCEIRK